MEGPDPVFSIGLSEGRDRDASPKAAHPMAPRRQPTAGFAQCSQPTCNVIPMPLRAQNPPGDVGGANTNQQNSSDPHRWLSGSGRQVAEAGELWLEQQLHRAHRTVAVLGHDHFGDAAVGCFRVVVLVTVDHQHQVGVLLD